MHILVADRDPALGRLLGDMLKAEGHTVHSVTDGVSALALVRSESWDVMVLDAQLPLRSGLELLRMARSLGLEAAALVSTDRQDPKLKEATQSLKVSRLLSRPFDAFTILDWVQENRPAPKPEPAAPQYQAENLLLLGRLWSTRASGTLRLEPDGVAELASGGPVGPKGMDLVRQSLVSGKLWFSSNFVEGSGNRGVLTDVLYRAALNRSVQLTGDQILRYDFAILEDLPLPGSVRMALQAGGGRASVVGLSQRATVPAEVMKVLGALVALGVAHTEETRIEARRSIAPESRGGYQSERPFASLMPSGLASNSPSRSPRSEQFSTDRPFRTEPLPSSHEVRFQPSENRPPAEKRIIIQDEPRSGPPTNPTSSQRTNPQLGRGRASVAAALHAQTQPSNQQQRSFLERELQHLKGASPWTVLAVDRSASSERIQTAIERMRSRYQALVENPDPEIRHLAEQLLTLVKDSAAAVTDEMAEPKLETNTIGGDDDEFFEKGMIFAKRNQWQQAENWFAKARDRAAGSSRNLAWLGWATAQNPERPSPRREEEGITLLRLAEQFDPENGEAAFLLARLLANHDPDAAMRRLARVLKLKPDHPEALQLLRKLRSRMEQKG